MNRLFHKFFMPFLFVFFTFFPCIYESDSLAQCRIELINNKIKLDVTDKELRNVLLEIQKQTGIEFTLDQEHAEDHIAYFSDFIPVDKLFGRILRHYNYGSSLFQMGKSNLSFPASR